MTMLIAFFPLLPLLIISIPVLVGIIREMDLIALCVTWPFLIVLFSILLAITIELFEGDDQQKD